MGIRYDRDSLDLKEGSVLFFMDDFSLLSLKEKINNSIDKGLVFFAWKAPGDFSITFGISHYLIKGFHFPGFILGPFSPDLPIVTIPLKQKISDDRVTEQLCEFPPFSTTFEEYEHELTVIKDSIGEKKDKKVVAARVISEKGVVDAGATYCNLIKNFDQSYVYCFGSSHTGVWIGASPELLLESHTEGEIKTMALAGTREGDINEIWDYKNLKEHQIVVDYIIQELKKFDFEVILEDQFTKRYGNISHLCTPIQGKITKDTITLTKLQKLIHSLSPTPALSGQPKEMALTLIKHLENFDRGYYGGYCGLFRAIDSFCFNVNIRCMAIEKDRYCLYAGGGITSESIIQEEWLETIRKASNIRNSIIFK